MLKIQNLKTYLKTPYTCFIPKCRSKCCVNAPLPEDFLPKHLDKIQRPIFSGVNIGQNDPRDTYNSIIYSTRPITFIGIDENGNKLYGITQERMEQLQLKSMEDINRLLAEYEAKKIYNYCPFIMPNARCSVYNERPPICREFGTMPGKLNICPDKASRLDILKFYAKTLFNVKENFNIIKTLFKK